MAYRMKCNRCSNVFTAQSCRAECTHVHCRSSHTSVLPDVAEAVAEAAMAYLMVDTICDVAGGLGDLVGSMFD